MTLWELFMSMTFLPVDAKWTIYNTNTHNSVIVDDFSTLVGLNELDDKGEIL